MPSCAGSWSPCRSSPPPCWRCSPCTAAAPAGRCAWRRPRVPPRCSRSRDEVGEEGGRLALALWVLSPGVVLYLATSADAVFATVLGAAALAAHRGLARRSVAWTAAGGVLLWAGSMLTYSAVLLLAFL